MQNVLDAEPARQAARRVAKKISDAAVAARFEKLAFERLLFDPRNLRPATVPEIAAAPRWAQEAASHGEVVSVFKLNRGASMLLHNLARRLNQVSALASAQALRPGQERLVCAARDFIRKIDRADYETLARKARLLSGHYAGWNEASEIVCEACTVAATEGRAWTRITSLAELRGVGREMKNCLARTSETAAYGGQLKDGRAQFWVLRDARAVALMVAMASTSAPTDFREVKGPRNTPVSRTNADLQCLAGAILAPHGDPPPPPETNPPTAAQIVLGLPASGQPSLSSLLLALGCEEPIAHVGVGISEVTLPRRRRRAS